MNDPVLAICCSDIHLSLKPPLARAEEPNWFEAMARPLREIITLMQTHKAILLVAGDIFDKWNAPAELINFAMRELPHLFYAIPGQHDLPSHRHDLAHRSAYGTLVESCHITELTPKPIRVNGLILSGFPFGSEISCTIPFPSKHPHVALMHEYLWVPGHCYTGAPKESKLGKHAKKFAKFDAVIVGDNHIGFSRTLKSGTHLMNCGTLLKRKSNEARYKPQVGLLHQSGKITPHLLDTSKDIITELVTEECDTPDDEDDIADFIETLAKVEASDLNFKETLERTMDKQKTAPPVREHVRKAYEG